MYTSDKTKEGRRQILYYEEIKSPVGQYVSMSNCIIQSNRKVGRGKIMGESGIDKNNRVLLLYSKLLKGQILKKNELAEQFHVSEKSIQRDLESIRDFLDRQATEGGYGNQLIYDFQERGYRLEQGTLPMLNNAEILAVCKILLDSRAFEKKQMDSVIDKLLMCCVPEKSRKQVSSLILNEKFHYTELSQKPASLELLWQLGQAVKGSCYTEIEYFKVKDGTTVSRKVMPVAIMFSEYYFYLAAYITGIDKEKEFTYAEDPYPTIYRVDRIRECKVLKERFRIPYRERFKEGEFRKRIQFMYGGRLKRIEFKYVGYDVSVILDKLPTAEVISKDEEGWEIRAEVFGDGVDMWLRSQGEYIKGIKYTII